MLVVVLKWMPRCLAGRTLTLLGGAGNLEPLPRRRGVEAVEEEEGAPGAEAA